MKKIFGLLAALVLVMGCDDGEMTFKSFDFSTPTTAATFCSADSNIIYVIKGTEVLILNLNRSQLLNVPSKKVDGAYVPTNITIGSTYTLLYRNYNAAVSRDAICSEGGVVAPIVLEQWSGVGTLQIITTEKRDDKTKVLTGYSHQITIKNITFSKGGEEITIVDNLFGSVTTPLGFTFDFTDADDEITPIKTCDANSTSLYKTNTAGTELLNIKFESGVFANTEGTKTITIDNSTSTEILFRTYSSSVNKASICDPSPTINPVAKWKARADNGAQIIIVTKLVNNAYEHSVYLKGVVFVNSDSPTETYTPDSNDASGNYFMGVYTTNP